MLKHLDQGDFEGEGLAADRGNNFGREWIILIKEKRLEYDAKTELLRSR
jgi:hypothetical protein